MLSLLFLSASLQISVLPESLSKAWGLWPTPSSFRHRLEGEKIEGKTLNLDLWYEDFSATKTGQPTDALFCRIAHILIYGRHLDRSKASLSPLKLAFEKLKEIDEVKLTFFSVHYDNEPHSPQWAKKTDSSTPSQLRVVWERKERIIPYLSYSIRRGEWATVSGILKTYPQLTMEDFQNKACGQVLKLAPNLKANFKEISTYWENLRKGQSQ